MKKWKKQKHTGLAIYHTEAGMFLEKLVFSLFLLFLILKNEINIFEISIQSENLTLKIDLAYEKAPHWSNLSNNALWHISILILLKNPYSLLVR